MSSSSLLWERSKSLQTLNRKCQRMLKQLCAVDQISPSARLKRVFSETAFSDERVKKLSLLCGGLEVEFLFRATYYMHFPFLTVEVR